MVKHQHQQNLVMILVTVAAGLFLSLGGLIGRSVAARGTPPAPSGKDNPTDDLQRSIRLDTYTLDAESGPARGENIYFYKCWMCHNKYAESAPYLKELYKRPNLMTGEPVNDETVAEQIKKGSPGMPSFGTTLSDADIADLRTYIKEGKCCVEGENPPANPWYRAETHKWPVQSELSGGATGSVRVASGDSPEGVGVQLIAPNGVRTTVYTNGEGRYEFPKMQAGVYTLRIPTPLVFKPYRRDSVEIDGPTKLDEIVLERVSQTDDLPPTPEIESQLSGAELLWNLPGTGVEKATFQRACSPCHEWQQVLRNRYDERSWGLIVDRMMHYSGTALAIRLKNTPNPDEDYNTIVKWLAKIRGPESRDAPLRAFPRPRGGSTRVIVTEYELPRNLLALHDVYGDAKGNIWYTSHKTQYFGKLDPRTGIATEHTVPLTPGGMPGTHHVEVDKNGIVWLSENWSHNLDRFDPQTGQVTQVHLESSVPLSAPAFGNFAIDSAGFIWYDLDFQVRKIDPQTGKILQHYPLQVNESYASLLSYDGNFWAGSGPARVGNTAELLDLRTGKWLNLNTGAHMATAKRGGFDPYGNAWFGGGDGALVELNAKAGRIVEHWPPTAPSPMTDFYEAMPDKNGEVWAGVLHGRQMVRLDPRTEKWTVYQLPEPFAYDRYNWIDASTHPVTVWYVDYDGYLVRVQPLE
jgi:streptogramin lyase/cytochrome c5